MSINLSSALSAYFTQNKIDEGTDEYNDVIQSLNNVVNSIDITSGGGVDTFDYNGDGTVSEDELIQYIQSISKDTVNYSNDDLTTFFNVLDFDGSGSLSSDEISAYMEKDGTASSFALWNQLCNIKNDSTIETVNNNLTEYYSDFIDVTSTDIESDAAKEYAEAISNLGSDATQEEINSLVSEILTSTDVSVSEKLTLLEQIQENYSDYLEEYLSEDDSFYCSILETMAEDDKYTLEDIKNLRTRYFAIQGDNLIDWDTFDDVISAYVSIFENKVNDSDDLEYYNNNIFSASVLENRINKFDDDLQEELLERLHEKWQTLTSGTDEE